MWAAAPAGSPAASRPCRNCAWPGSTRPRMARLRDPEGDARALPFADASFDRVVSVTTQCFIRDWPRALQEIVRVTPPVSLSAFSIARACYGATRAEAAALAYTTVRTGIRTRNCALPSPSCPWATSGFEPRSSCHPARASHVPLNMCFRTRCPGVASLSSRERSRAPTSHRDGISVINLQNSVSPYPPPGQTQAAAEFEISYFINDRPAISARSAPRRASSPRGSAPPRRSPPSRTASRESARPPRPATHTNSAG